jgi:hypothetical protein
LVETLLEQLQRLQVDDADGVLAAVRDVALAIARRD